MSGAGVRRVGLWCALAAILMAGAALRCDRLAQVDTLFDEEQDLKLLASLARAPNPFMAVPSEQFLAWDQARLPFYLTGLIAYMTGDASLLTMRRVSVACALAVLLVVFLLGRDLFGPAAGLLAAAFQAASIFDAGFSRLALTSSLSMFLASFLLSLWCLFRAAREDRVAWWWAAGVAAGIACAAKGFGVFALLIAISWLASRPCGLVVPWRRVQGTPRTPIGCCATPGASH